MGISGDSLKVVLVGAIFMLSYEVLVTSAAMAMDTLDAVLQIWAWHFLRLTLGSFPVDNFIHGPPLKRLLAYDDFCIYKIAAFPEVPICTLLLSFVNHATV